MNRRFLAAAVFVVALTSCNDDAVGVNDPRFRRYTLRTIDGRAVPTIFQETANSRLEFLSGAFRLNADGTFTDSTELRVTPMFRGQPLPGGEVQHYYDVAWGLHHISHDTVYLSSLRGEEYYMVFQASGTLMQQLGGGLLNYR
ncbi:MAG TPA: hypothetical protein VGC44_12005 [Longimicrobiales bacterium]